jgi:hypothetical protein
VKADPLYEGENIYKCDDGTMLKIKNFFTTIKRTSAYDGFGEPVYIVNTQNIVMDEVPKNLWKTSQ